MAHNKNIQLYERDSMFWSSDGLKLAAQLVKAEAERSNQKTIAIKAGVNEQTVTNFLLNLHNSDGKIVKQPKPDTLLLLASAVTNPETGEPFEPEEFLAIARGKISRFGIPKTAEEPGTYQIDGHPYPAGQRELKRLMKKRSVKQAAKDWELAPERLEELLNTTNSDRAIPTAVEFQRIVSESYPESPLINRLSDLYLEQKKNGSVAKRSASADSQ